MSFHIVIPGRRAAASDGAQLRTLARAFCAPRNDDGGLSSPSAHKTIPPPAPGGGRLAPHQENHADLVAGRQVRVVVWLNFRPGSYARQGEINDDASGVAAVG